MKGKITIALVVLALVFGTVFAACDNGSYPSPDTNNGNAVTVGNNTTTETVLDYSVTTKSGVNTALELDALP